MWGKGALAKIVYIYSFNNLFIAMRKKLKLVLDQLYGDDEALTDTNLKKHTKGHFKFHTEKCACHWPSLTLK